MTGIDDPYEQPEAPDILVRDGTVDEAVAAIVARARSELGVHS